MNTQSKGLILFSFLVILSLALGACATPTPATIIETVVVEKEGQTVIETVVVEKEVEVEVPAKPAEAEGPIIVGQGNLIPCLPLPDVPTAVSASAPAVPSIVSDVPQMQAQAAFALKVEPQQGGGKIYRVGTFSDITSTNFWGANGPDNTIYNAFMVPQRLQLYIETDKYFTFVPQVAVDFPEPLSQEGDFWVVEIPIRDDIQWSDGTPFTAEDVAWTANAALDLGIVGGNWSQWYDSNYLDRMEVVDEFTVKIYYHTKPGLLRHESGTLQAPLLNKAYWEPIVNEALAPVEALGDSPTEEDLVVARAEAHDTLYAYVPDGEPLAGGFLLTKWEPGAFIQMDANPNFMDKGLVVEQWADASYRDSRGIEYGAMQGDPEVTYELGPHVETIIYSVYASKDAAILAMMDGEVDFVLDSLGLTKGLANQVRTAPDLAVIENPPNSYRYLSFNVRRAPMNDCAFRQAVAVLIDKDFVATNILQDTIIPLYSVVAPANVFWYNPDVPLLGKGMDREARVEYAKTILKQAGYTWEGGNEPTWDGQAVVGAGRLLMPDGTPVPLLHMPAPSPGYDAMRSTFAIWIESWLNEFGIPTQAELAAFNTLIPIIFTEQDFDMFILGWSADIFPGHLHDGWIEEQAGPDGNNAGGYVNADYEVLAKELVTCEVLEECRDIAFELQMMLGTEIPTIALFNSPILEAYRPSIVEFPWTEGLSGVQYSHQYAAGHLMQNYVVVK